MFANPGILSDLAELVALPGGVGAEGPVAKWLGDRLEESSLRPTQDRLGNLLLLPEAAPARILVCAHMDQVGYMVSRIEGDLAECLMLGSPEAPPPASPKVLVAGCSHPPLAADLEAQGDWGGLLRSEALSEVRVGDRATFAGPLEAVDTDRIRAPALDNRLGCLLLLNTARLHAGAAFSQVAFAWTVREETDQAGALRVARALEPDVVIALDTTWACTGGGQAGSAISLGAGPAITLLDGGMVCDAALLQAFDAAAAAPGIAWQREVVADGLSEAGRVQGELGIPALSLLVPIEHPHTSHEEAHLGDVDAAGKLLELGLSETLAGLSA